MCGVCCMCACAVHVCTHVHMGCGHRGAVHVCMLMWGVVTWVWSHVHGDLVHLLRELGLVLLFDNSELSH